MKEVREKSYRVQFEWLPSRWTPAVSGRCLLLHPQERAAPRGYLCQDLAVTFPPKGQQSSLEKKLIPGVGRQSVK